MTDDSAHDRDLKLFGEMGESGQGVLNVRAEVERRRSRITRLIERIGGILAQPWFLLALLIPHVAWIVLNIPALAWYEPWDPYPFACLALIASAEAPFLSLLILMRQHRDERLQELRQELNMQVALHNEAQVTALIIIVDQLRRQQQLPSEIDDELLEKLKQTIDPKRVLERLRQQLDAMEKERT